MARVGLFTIREHAFESFQPSSILVWPLQAHWELRTDGAVVFVQSLPNPGTVLSGRSAIQLQATYRASKRIRDLRHGNNPNFAANFPTSGERFQLLPARFKDRERSYGEADNETATFSKSIANSQASDDLHVSEIASQERCRRRSHSSARPQQSPAESVPNSVTTPVLIWRTRYAAAMRRRF
jgi:hypothetical protein